MDRNLYQQCGGAHVFRRMVMSNYRFVCMYLPLCVRIPVCVTIFPTSYIRITDVMYVYVCLRVHMRVPSSLEYQVWSICSVSRVLHRECGIKGEAIEIRATSAKIPQNKSRINGSVRFPNSKFDFIARFTRRKKDTFPSSCSHDATSRQVWFICICLYMCGWKLFARL